MVITDNDDGDDGSEIDKFELNLYIYRPGVSYLKNTICTDLVSTDTCTCTVFIDIVNNMRASKNFKIC